MFKFPVTTDSVTDLLLLLEDRVDRHYKVSGVDSRRSHEEWKDPTTHLTLRVCHHTMGYHVQDDGPKEVAKAIEQLWSDISEAIPYDSPVIWRRRPEIAKFSHPCECCGHPTETTRVSLRIGSPAFKPDPLHIIQEGSPFPHL